MALLNAVIHGFAFRFLWPSYPVINRYDDVIGALTGVAGILFATRFLNTKQYTPAFHRIFLLLLFTYAVDIVLILSGYFRIGVLLLEISSLVLVVAFFIAAWQTLRNGYKPAAFFLIAWSFLLLGVVVFILNNFTIIPSTTFATYSIQIGSALEALLLSMALANRIRVYKKQTREAEHAALRSLERNKKLIVEQNIMLEKKVAERTAELEKANSELLLAMENLKTTQAQLVQQEKMASLGELTAGIAHEIQNPLNFVNNFSEVSTELADELFTEITAGKTKTAADLALALKANLQKILRHGQRADNIVKGMLEHSRMKIAKREKVALNEIVDEALRLSYHALRANDKSFSAILETHFGEDVGTVPIVARDISRVMLNIFNNAFYAMQEKKKVAPSGYQPRLLVHTKRMNGQALISICDNGAGISPQVKEKIYQPFFTTKPAGEGTGLGLSISYDIVTREHGGSLQVDSVDGDYTEFRVQLPLEPAEL
jgi:signal transduction histidine kinase